MLDNNNLNLFPDAVPESTKEELLNPSVSLIGQAFRGIAHKIFDPLVKFNIVKDKELDDFIQSVQTKTSVIPTENRDDSKLGLTLKAMEDSPYQLNSEQLREMFANLIAATVDDRRNSQVHPSFSTLLKELSHEDALLLNDISNNADFPIVTIRLENEEQSTGVNVERNVILLENRIINNPVSISSLERLGLISINEDTYLTASVYQNRYLEFKNSKLYKEYESILPRHRPDGMTLTKIDTINGKLSLTAFGKQFLTTVLNKTFV